MQLRIAHQVTHDTHHLYNMRGVIFCMNCGYSSGGASFESLAKLCLDTQRATRTSYSQRVINQLSQSILPDHIRRNYGVWPEEILLANFHDGLVSFEAFSFDVRPCIEACEG